MNEWAQIVKQMNARAQQLSKLKELVGAELTGMKEQAQRRRNEAMGASTVSDDDDDEGHERMGAATIANERMGSR